MGLDARSALNVYRALNPWVLPALVGVTGALSLAHLRTFPVLRLRAREIDARMVWPRVSIIVPARNEARNLAVLLPSLLALRYPDVEILVVDDVSSDATAQVARRYAAASNGRLRVIDGPGPPPGWTGKNYACFLGARKATGDWLLFTDADTEHAPRSLAVAVAAAEMRSARALSLFPRQVCVGFWERLLLPFAYQNYFAGVRPRALRRAGGPALASGQYLLVRRETYAAVGGHQAVAGSIIEDVALAGVLKRAGAGPLLFRGDALVWVRMYKSFGALAEGFTKNAAQFLSQQRAGAAHVVLGSAAGVALVPALLTAALSGQRHRVVAALMAYVAQCLLLAPWMRAFAVPVRYAALGPLAALTFTGIACSSLVHTLFRRPVRWKGRGYSASGGGIAGTYSARADALRDASPARRSWLPAGRRNGGSISARTAGHGTIGRN